MKNLLVSFSGGETSGFMCDWLIKNKSNDFKMLFAIANTSKEKEETLEFANYCDKKFNLGLVWIEATFNEYKHTGYKITNFKDAKRNGEVFEDMIKCYGLPNTKYPHCTRELKSEPLSKLAKDFLGDNWKAIGIRSDEIDRVSVSRVKNQLYYPLIESAHITKQHVNLFWSKQERRLNLKGYEGNCNKCWKKSFRKLMTIEAEEKIKDDWWIDMENKYSNYIPKHRNRKENNNKITFYRGNKSGLDIRDMSKLAFKKATDDTLDINTQESIFGVVLDKNDGCIGSCEPFI